MAEQTGFEASIKPLFRDQDRESMLQSFDLWDLEDVRANSTAILQRLGRHAMRWRVVRRAHRAVLELDRIGHGALNATPTGRGSRPSHHAQERDLVAVLERSVVHLASLEACPLVGSDRAFVPWEDVERERAR